MQRLRGVDVLIDLGICDSLSRAYQLTAPGSVLPRGVVVRIGRRVYIEEARLRQFLAAGGAALPGGWRREPEGR